MSDRRAISAKWKLQSEKSVRYEGYIGQTEGGKWGRCPIEELYRPNGSCKPGKVSDRKALSDKRRVESGKNVR
ncbi:hypothetical protein J7E32_01395 [Bacillus sp. ISL-55]|nr:hypothetical protein [Bacillus sp. ISL-55]